MQRLNTLRYSLAVSHCKRSDLISNVPSLYRCSEKHCALFDAVFASRHFAIYSRFSSRYVKHGDWICMRPTCGPTRLLKTATQSPGNGHDWCFLSQATMREDPRPPAECHSPLLSSHSFRPALKKGGFTSRPAPCESIPDVLPEWRSAAHDPGSPTLQSTSHWTLFKSPGRFLSPSACVIAWITGSYRGKHATLWNSWPRQVTSCASEISKLLTICPWKSKKPNTFDFGKCSTMHSVRTKEGVLVSGAAFHSFSTRRTACVVFYCCTTKLKSMMVNISECLDFH